MADMLNKALIKKDEILGSRLIQFVSFGLS
jgi:hypothetical protein